ncbi:protein-serine O-palmitoleoyltransferase porcupine-like [Mytilus edulis]|uniref:protein-serine O-palmitoleoyltransferase porcupine-like n=1 Tax=Mytilus edulis TaxID=6550 RepID=UPI0039EE62E0
MEYDNYDDMYDEDMLQDMMAQYGDYEFDDVEEYGRIPFKELINNCVIPTLSQASHSLFPIYLMCFVFKSTLYLGGSDSKGESFMPSWFPHLTSAIFGGMALYSIFEKNIVYILVCGVLGYVILLMSYRSCRSYSGAVMSLFIVTFIVLCELVLVQRKDWHNVRGAQIILSMKLIGLAFDISSEKTDMPRADSYLGYVFCVGTVIFGPWTSYHDYTIAVQQNITKGFSFGWLLKVIRSIILTVVCLTVSTCLTQWLILDSGEKWLVAYRDAQSFRFSHYFICFVAETSATLAGLGFTEVMWGLTVSKPQNIELPRSLVDVVTNWNLPMHYWLKNYVFLVVQPYGVVIAVFLTYAASSLLHGLNFQFAAVLFSLGFYTYVESVFRSKLSRIFNACIGTRKCKEECTHEYKYTHPCVILTNLIFGALSMFHLAYLGLMFDNSVNSEEGYDMYHTLEKWSSLSYASHWIVLGTYIFAVLI